MAIDRRVGVAARLGSSSLDGTGAEVVVVDPTGGLAVSETEVAR